MNVKCGKQNVKDTAEMRSLHHPMTTQTLILLNIFLVDGDCWITIQWMWMCLERFFRTWPTFENKESKEALAYLHTELETLSWGIEIILQYSICHYFLKELQRHDFNDPRTNIMANLFKGIEGVRYNKIKISNFFVFLIY